MKHRIICKLSVVAGLLAMGPSALSSQCCVADFTGDDQVSADEVLSLLSAWGSCTGSCPEDIDDSGEVNSDDLLTIIDRWGQCPEANGGDYVEDPDSPYMDLAVWGKFHGSNNNSRLYEMIDGRTPITTEAMDAYNNLRSFLDLSALDYEQVGQWAFSKQLTNNDQWWGNDLKGVGLYYAMQGAKVGWITDEDYDPQFLADIQRTARRVCDPYEMKIQVLNMARQVDIDGFVEYLESNGMTDTFINTIKMEPHYAGWMHGRCHGFRNVEGVAINHDLNHLTVLSWDQMQPFMNDTFDWPQWNALDVSDSGVIDYFQGMVILGDPDDDNL